METKKFNLNTSVLPQTIYSNREYRTTNLGLEIPPSVRQELREFLESYLKTAGASKDGVFLRVDLYPDPEEENVFWVIEVNGLFVDGWGIGLNLARAVGHSVELNGSGLSFPGIWTTEDRSYLPELELAQQELHLLTGQDFDFMAASNCRINQTPAYWYGRLRPHQNLVPKFGQELDDKIVLEQMQGSWNGSHIKIPPSFHHGNTPWEKLPPKESLVFKLRKKWEDPEKSVRFGTEIGKGKDVKRGYDKGEIIAQTLLKPALSDGRPVQVIIMTADIEPVTGYLQTARPGTKIINDDSVHGPVIFV